MTTITVTDEHIELGIAHSSRLCPVSLAFADAGFPNTDVYTGCALLPRERPEQRCKRVPLPDEACLAIQEFDIHGTMSPFSFEIDL